MASAQSDVDGRLVDYAAKGTKIDLDGIEKVDGGDNYKLKLTLSGGQENPCGSTPRPSSKPKWKASPSAWMAPSIPWKYP